MLIIIIITSIQFFIINILVQRPYGSAQRQHSSMKENTSNNKPQTKTLRKQIIIIVIIIHFLYTIRVTRASATIERNPQ